MEAIAMKTVAHLPQLIARALAGDPVAIGLLAAGGFAAIVAAIKRKDG